MGPKEQELLFAREPRATSLASLRFEGESTEHFRQRARQVGVIARVLVEACLKNVCVQQYIGDGRLGFTVESLRRQFPALCRTVDGHAAAYFDGPGGTQTPECVIEAVSRSLAHTNANCHGHFATSRENDLVLEAARAALADLLGASDPDTVCFGPNMTSLTFAFSRALARTWTPGDEVLVTWLDHDANVTPWVMAAQDAGATVRFVNVHPEDCTLDLEDLRGKLSERTRLVAVGCASNSVGTINPVKQICGWARDVGALSFLDAVHYAPHAAIDVDGWGCDLLACSSYKFCGPHVGMLWGRRALLD